MESIDVIFISGARGGFENMLNLVGRHLVKEGYRVRFVPMIDSNVSWVAEGIEQHCLDLDKDHLSFDEARQRYAALLSQDAVKPSIVFVAGWPYLNYVAKGATSDAGLPVPVAAWLHDDMTFYEEGGCGGLDMLQFADICFAINSKIASDICGAWPDKIVYRVNNAIDPAIVHYATDRNTRKLACVGRLSDKKAVPIILYAMERTRIPWELEVIGDGEDAAAIRDLCRELRLEQRVHFQGWDSRPWERVSDCRALVISSIYEGGPLSAMEALACGMRVITTPVGVLPEIIREDVNGILVPFGDPGALAAAMDHLEELPVTADTAAACRASMEPFLPEAALYDFTAKTKASISCVALPQRFQKDKQDLYVTC